MYFDYIMKRKNTTKKILKIASLILAILLSLLFIGNIPGLVFNVAEAFKSFSSSDSYAKGYSVGYVVGGLLVNALILGLAILLFVYSFKRDKKGPHSEM